MSQSRSWKRFDGRDKRVRYVQRISSTQVSRAVKLLDDDLEAWRNRPLGDRASSLERLVSAVLVEIDDKLALDKPYIKWRNQDG